MYEIKIIGDEVLRKRAEEITEFNHDLKKISEEMMETMHNYNGIGLAAPQVNIVKRIIVTDILKVEQGYNPMVFVNPKIIESQGETIYEEGCLSIPGVNEDILRPERILLHYQDIYGEEKKAEFENWMARVLQHEVDHLNGILFIDYLSPIKQKLVLNRFVQV
jgi:peptide deformylase